MTSKRLTKRPDYTALGTFLKEARKKPVDEKTGKIPSIVEIAKLLDVSRGFVYQVESGIRKPKDGEINRWASVYGVRPTYLWKCLNRIPMDFVRTLRSKPKPITDDPFAKLTKEEKQELSPYLDFIKWKSASRAKMP